MICIIIIIIIIVVLLLLIIIIHIYIYIYIDKDLSLSLYIYIYIYTHLLLYFSQIGCILDWSSEAARVRCHLRRVYQQFCQQKSGSMRKPLAFYNSLCRKNA